MTTLILSAQAVFSGWRVAVLDGDSVAYGLTVVSRDTSEYQTANVPVFHAEEPLRP